MEDGGREKRHEEPREKNFYIIYIYIYIDIFLYIFIYLLYPIPIYLSFFVSRSGGASRRRPQALLMAHFSASSPVLQVSPKEDCGRRAGASSGLTLQSSGLTLGPRTN